MAGNISPREFLRNAISILTSYVRDEDRAYEGSGVAGSTPPPPYSGSESESESGSDASMESTDPPSPSPSPSPIRNQDVPHEELDASLPYNQFIQQIAEEEHRFREQPKFQRTCNEAKIQRLARQKVEDHWRTQGIWNDEWKDEALALWKHESRDYIKFIDLEEQEKVSGPYTASERCRRYGVSGIYRSVSPQARRPDPDPRCERHLRFRRGALATEKEASRPFHQFTYQLAQARKDVHRELADHTFIGTTSTGRSQFYDHWIDYNTRAYNKVKETWIKRGLWDTDWGILPGFQWKHEQRGPREDLPYTHPDDEFSWGNRDRDQEQLEERICQDNPVDQQLNPLDSAKSVEAETSTNILPASLVNDRNKEHPAKVDIGLGIARGWFSEPELQQPFQARFHVPGPGNDDGTNQDNLDLRPVQSIESQPRSGPRQTIPAKRARKSASPQPSPDARLKVSRASRDPEYPSSKWGERERGCMAAAAVVPPLLCSPTGEPGNDDKKSGAAATLSDGRPRRQPGNELMSETAESAEPAEPVRTQPTRRSARQVNASEHEIAAQQSISRGAQRRGPQRKWKSRAK